jgi:peptide/nickel transport system permease protein
VPRFILRRLSLILLALWLANFFGFAYAHLVLPIRASRIPYLAAQVSSEPLLPAYAAYLGGALRLEFGTLPGEDQTIGAAILGASATSLGLLTLALALSVALGLALGLRAVRMKTQTTSRWLTLLSTIGLAMPSFYVGSILITAAFFYILHREEGPSFLTWGFGWDHRLVLPALALMARPTVQIAQVTAGLLEEELGKRHVVVARSVGHPWHVIRQRHALRSILAPVILTIVGASRLLMGELILVEWLFRWPGLGQLFAQALVPGQGSQSLGSSLFLNPPVVATVLTVFAALFLLTDLIASILVRAADPRLRVPEEGTGSAGVVSSHPKSARRNWPLRLGSLIVLSVIVIAITGPALVPHDPLEEHTIVQVGSGWETAPFPAFTVPGFPLGSDFRGRDLLSRLLCAVRPTMTLVAIVTLVRLVLGIAIGVTSGWSNGRAGRLLDAAISSALSVPLLMVALGAIAAVGIEIGLLAFVVGLSVTGWAETAKIVREQTRLVKGQQYVEAARALGQSRFQTLARHVLPQVRPMILMLFALEVSSTLMTTAGLGFLGYYIGGDVWVEVADFVARRMSGTPELGQMLATSDLGIVRLGVRGLPWATVVVGTAIFVIVLGFNLLGEGLRQRLSLERAPKRTLAYAIANRAGLWIRERVFLSTSGWVRRHAVHTAIVGAAVLIVTSGLVWLQAQAAKLPKKPAVDLVVPGGHLWASARRDPYGTLWSEAPGPSDPQVLWTFETPAKVSGGPAVAADGTVYVATEGGMLYALHPTGLLLWQVSLPAAAVGGPALGAGGEVYVADKEGGLSVLAPGGDLLWRFEPEGESVATAGPVVAADGTIYYAIRNSVQAVSSQGLGLWKTQASYEYRVMPLQLSPTGEFLFWQDTVFDAREGSRQHFEFSAEADQYIVGADGRTYLRAEHNVMQWRWTASGVEIVETTRWDFRRLGTFSSPDDAGLTREQVVWLFYTNPYDATRIVWLDTSGRVLSVVRYPMGRGYMIGVDPDAITYVCGGKSPRYNPLPVCLAFAPDTEEPLWLLSLEKGELVEGGALVPGRLYVTLRGTEEGFLYAIGDAALAAQTGQGAQTATTPKTLAPAPTLSVTAAISTALPLTPSPLAAVSTTPPATPPPTATVSTPPLPTPTSSLTGQTTHVIQPGENLFRIALRYGMTVEAIAGANGIANPAHVYAGQALIIPSPGAPPPPAPTGEITYVVQPGDNLFRIALRYDVGYLDLAQLNGITNPARIYVGQVLRIPPR